jgi:uncharacterized glyoxalase superfamily protein PhnB
MSMKTTSLLLWVQENHISEKFYKRLGFDVKSSADDHSVISLNGFEIILVNMRDDEEFVNDSLASDKGRGMYIYIKVNDIDETYKKFVENGIKPATEPRDWKWGNREFILKDPDGYKLCFWQLIK